MATITELATIARQNLETRTRTDGTHYISRTDTAPEWVETLCHEAHGDMFPDDWRYQFIADALDIIADEEEADADERIDADVHVYTHDLMNWLGSRADRYSYVDDAVEELGRPDGGIIEEIKAGEYAERREVYDLVYSFLETKAEETDEEAEETADSLA